MIWIDVCTAEVYVRGSLEVSFNAKAWNARIACSWLAEVMARAAQGYPLGYDEGRLTLVTYALSLGSF